MTDAIRFDRDGAILRGECFVGEVERYGAGPSWFVWLMQPTGTMRITRGSYPTLRAAKSAARTLLAPANRARYEAFFAQFRPSAPPVPWEMLTPHARRIWVAMAARYPSVFADAGSKPCDTEGAP